MAGDNPIVSAPTTSMAAKVTTTKVLLVSLVIAAANLTRKGCVIFNSGTTALYVSLAPTSAVLTPTYVVAPGASLVLDIGPAVYVGPVSAVRASADGYVTVYELI